MIYITGMTVSHYNDIIMGAIVSQITSLMIVYSIVYSDTDERRHQSSVSLAFVRGIHRGPVNSQHKWPVTRKMFPFDDVIMFNSSPLSAAYMRRWTGSALVQIMACGLVGAKPYLNQCSNIVYWTPGNKFPWNSNRNSIILIQENAFEIVVCQNGGHFVQGEMT